MSDNQTLYISYRREDSAGWAGRLQADLRSRLGPDVQVSMGIDGIPAGEDFARAIDDAVGRCGALVALIGPGWLSAQDAQGHSSLEDPNDFVRIEIEAALRRGICVIPALVGDASLPGQGALPEPLHGLIERHAVRVDNDRSLGVTRLVKAIGFALEEMDPTVTAPLPKGEVKAFEVNVRCPDGGGGGHLLRFKGSLEGAPGPGSGAGHRPPDQGVAMTQLVPPSFVCGIHGRDLTEEVRAMVDNEPTVTASLDERSHVVRPRQAADEDVVVAPQWDGLEQMRREPARSAAQPCLASANDEIDIAVKKIIWPGRIGFNPPAEMRQGDLKRISVTIARSRELDDELRAGLTGRGVAQLEDLSTSPFMTVQLRGPAFDVMPLDPEEQLVTGVTLWEFEVLPLRAGRRVLQLCVCMSIRLPDGPDQFVRHAVPVFERNIRVRIDPIYGTQQFASRHWKSVTAIVGLGGAVAAWIELIHGKP